MIIIRSGNVTETKALEGATPSEAMNEILSLEFPISISVGSETFFLPDKQARIFFCRGMLFATDDEFQHPA